MNREIPFGVPIWISSVKNWTDYKNEILSQVELNEHDGHESDYYKFKELNMLPPYGEALLEILKPNLGEFAEVYPNQIRIDTIWCQRYGRGCYHGPHTHGSLGYSAIFYADMKGEHQGTTFIAPFLDFVQGNTIEWTPEVSEGDIIFFPSAIVHMCKPVQSDELRTIFSFNIRGMVSEG